MVLIGVGFDGLDMIRIGVGRGIGRGIGITIKPILHGKKNVEFMGSYPKVLKVFLPFII